MMDTKSSRLMVDMKSSTVMVDTDPVVHADLSLHLSTTCT